MENNVSNPAPAGRDGITRLEATAAARAARLGKTIDQLLVDDRHSLRTSNYPTADCFRPHEVELFARGDLSAERIRHGETCDACAALLVAAQSWERPLNVFMDEVRGHRHVRVADDVRLPLTDVLCAGGPVAALGLGVAAWVFYRWNPTLSISFRPLGWTPVVTLLVATLLTIVAIPLGVYLARRFEFQGSFARFGGAAIAGVSVMVFAAFGANTMLAVNSNYQRVQSAEDLALAIAAWRIQTGSSESQPIKVPAITQTLAGNVVARVLDRGASTRNVSEAFEIYWDQRQSKNNRVQMVRQTLGTVYVGQLEQQPDGKMAVKTSSETIEVNASPAQLSRVKGDEPVLAIVPVDAQEASRVLPVAELGDHAAALTAEQR